MRKVISDPNITNPIRLTLFVDEHDRKRLVPKPLISENEKINNRLLKRPLTRIELSLNRIIKR